jgi:hypothetical protein
MATFEQSGQLKYQFGFTDKDTGAMITDISTIANDIGVSPQELTISYEPEFEAEAQGPDGSTESKVIGPRKGEFSMSGYAVCKGKLLANSFFWFDSQLFQVSSREIGYSNQEFQTASLSGTTYSNIDRYAVGTVDASSATGTPDLTDTALEVKGATYVVTSSGTMSSVPGIESDATEPGDYVHYDGTEWVYTQHPCNA